VAPRSGLANWRMMVRVRPSADRDQSSWTVTSSLLKVPLESKDRTAVCHAAVAVTCRGKPMRVPVLVAVGRITGCGGAAFALGVGFGRFDLQERAVLGEFERRGLGCEQGAEFTFGDVEGPVARQADT
jgi:hypothetical protein